MLSNPHLVPYNAFKRLLDIEGGYSDHPDDPGGKTRWGITEKVARKFNYRGSINLLPKELAFNIYRELYWDVNNLTSVSNVSFEVAFEIFECGVNLGPIWGARYLQMALNSMNRGERKDLHVDGVIGVKTLAELLEYSHDDICTIVKIQNILQGARYVLLTQKNRKLKSFVRGWIKRVF